MEFKKYPSIESQANNKAIFKARAKNPEMEDVFYIAYEKVDGANIQLIFTPNAPMIVGRRSGFISPNTSFFNIWNTLEKYKEELSRIQKYVDNQEIDQGVLKLCGELYGKGINNRVYYGEEQYICFFDAYWDDKRRTPRQLDDFLAMTKNNHLLAPIAGMFETLNEALNANEHFTSKLTPEGYDKPNISEGLVIRPFADNIPVGKEGEDAIFMLKKKDKAFAEAEGSPKPKDHNVAPELIKLQGLFSGFINQNRLLSVISKEGELTDISQLGKYLQLLVQDAKEDFLKEYEVPTDSKDLKLVYGGGNAKAAELIKAHIYKG